jgi:hypothetical protein
MFDGQIGNAPVGVYGVIRAERAGGTGHNAEAAGTAIFSQWLVDRQLHGRDDLAQEYERAELLGENISVLAVPAESGASGERLVHHGTRVDVPPAFAPKLDSK